MTIFIPRLVKNYEIGMTMNNTFKIYLLIVSCAMVVINLSAYAADWSAKAPLALSKQVYDNKSMAFIPHTGVGKFDNYLAMTINYEAIKPLFNQLETRVGRELKHRGEAHITVVTPVEYHQILKPYLSIQTINELAKGIQNHSFEVVCLGAFEKSVNNKKEQTYYVVVKSDDLMSVRNRIAQTFIKAGGSKKDFKVSAFYPHITVGFSARDLHLSDGAVKDDSSCAYPLTVE